MAFALGGGKRIVEQFAPHPAVMGARAYADVDIHISVFQLLRQFGHLWQGEAQANIGSFGTHLVKQPAAQHQRRVFVQGDDKGPGTGLRIKRGGGKQRADAAQHALHLRLKRFRSRRGQHPTSMWGRNKQRFAKQRTQTRETSG